MLHFAHHSQSRSSSRARRCVFALATAGVLAVGTSTFSTGSAFAAGPRGPEGLAPAVAATGEPTPTLTLAPEPVGPANPDVDDFTSCQGWDDDFAPTDNCDHPDPDPTPPTPDPTPDPVDPCLPPVGEPGGKSAADVPLTSLRMVDDEGDDLDLTTEEADCEVPTDGGGVSFTG